MCTIFALRPAEATYVVTGIRYGIYAVVRAGWATAGALIVQRPWLLACTTLAAGSCSRYLAVQHGKVLGLTACRCLQVIRVVKGSDRRQRLDWAHKQLW